MSLSFRFEGEHETVISYDNVSIYTSFDKSSIMHFIEKILNCDEAYKDELYESMISVDERLDIMYDEGNYVMDYICTDRKSKILGGLTKITISEKELYDACKFVNVNANANANELSFNLSMTSIINYGNVRIFTNLKKQQLLDMLKQVLDCLVNYKPFSYVIRNSDGDELTIEPYLDGCDESKASIEYKFYATMHGKNVLIGSTVITMSKRKLRESLEKI